MVGTDVCQDYHQEVANTGFGDMLHDHERNKKYFAALRKTIERMHAAGSEVHVLDIGTGTGILSMMAISAGADSVTACEAFLPMAECAGRIFEANGVQEKVNLIKKRSTEIKTGNGSDEMKRRANLLVAELLDTELIGEGALAIYNHAHKELLTADAVCIPAKANCYVQVVQSPLAAQWNSMKTLVNLDGEMLLRPPKEVTECKSEAALHDIQLSQLPLNQFRPITEAVKIFEFDFSRNEPHELERRKDMRIETKSVGSTDLVFYWWEIELDSDAEIVLSVAPFWTHPDFKSRTDAVQKLIAAGVPLTNCIPWRDHWLQAVYYIPKPLHFTKAPAEFILSCNHDEFSLWFDAFPAGASAVTTNVPRHSCTCQLHMTYSRSRIGQLNQAPRNKRFLRYLEESANLKDAHMLTLGDGCVLGLSGAKLGAASVICYEPHRFSRHFIKSLAATNELSNVTLIENLDDLDETSVARLTHIFAEPYFIISILPWDNLYFGKLLSRLKSQFSLPENVRIAPHSARIYALPIEFLDLHRIHSPVGNCEGFDLSLFDDMVTTSTALSQTKIEAQPLWEYPGRALSQQQELLCVTFENFEEAFNNAGEIVIEYPGHCNGIAIWVNWHIDATDSPKSIVSTGPTEPFAPGDFIKWDMFVRQGVQLFGEPKAVEKSKSRVYWTCEFEAGKGQLELNFDVKNDDEGNV